MEVSVIYPHQLFDISKQPVLQLGRVVYLVEEPLILTYNPIHRQKLIFHKLSMDAYEHRLQKNDYTVFRLTIHEHVHTRDVFKRLVRDGVTTVHIADTTDDYLEQAITTSGLNRIWYESPLFLLPKGEACERYQKSKRSMASFYKKLRKDRQILLEEDSTPIGKKWSFDAENRLALPKNIPIPPDPPFKTSSSITAAIAWCESVPAEQYGQPGCWLPYTHTGANAWLDEFLTQRLNDFGPYEDAISTRGTRLFHSGLSPLLNTGLLTPDNVLDAILTYQQKHTVRLSSVEGLVRQIIGWREFIRASYEVDGRAQRSSNFFKHTRSLPRSAWSGETTIFPLDQTIERCLRYGYTHHIERLMVAGNFFLLNQIHPDSVFRWFMGMYIDAYDWVMVPNVYGMSQYADGGSFATKPYISGGNYLRKMSDYPAGDWEGLWTDLYWHFLATHQQTLEVNHRLRIPLRSLSKQNQEKRQQRTVAVEHFWQKWQKQ